jgi:hypothetical protein
MLNKIIALIVVSLLLPTQSFARAQQSQLNVNFNQLASEVMEQKLSADEILNRSRELVQNAKTQGLTEEELLSTLNNRLSLQLSPEEIQSSIADLRANPSEDKLQKIAQDIANNQTGDKVFMVLLTFALMSLLLVGFFFLIADTHYPSY